MTINKKFTILYKEAPIYETDSVSTLLTAMAKATGAIKDHDGFTDAELTELKKTRDAMAPDFK